MVQRTSSNSLFAEQKLMISSGFRWEQIYNCQIYDFDNTLLCYLIPAYMFKKPNLGQVFNILCIEKSH
jgi:hypothetical protein